MKKLFVLLVGVMMLFVQQGFSQSSMRLMEDFSVVPPAGWAFGLNSSNYWRTDAVNFKSAPQAYCGTVPTQVGAVSILETQSYNFAGLPYVLLRFNHICKVSPSDTVRIEIGYYKGPGIYGDWKPLPSSSSVYKGGASNYGSTGFNAASYTDWAAANNLAQPSKTWWQKEEFDLRTDAGQQNVKFRFVIKHGSTAGTHVAYGWLIDDFEVLAATAPIVPPTVVFVSPFVRDTVYSTGPWEINAKVKSNTSVPIAVPILEWSIDNWITTSSKPMTMVKGDSLWKAEIPQYATGTDVVYRIIGKDTITNTFNTATISSGYHIKLMCGGGAGWSSKVFPYTGSPESLLLQPGIYEIECWGADGGIGAIYSNYNLMPPGGTGGYSKGTLTLGSAQTIYVYVGEKGAGQPLAWVTGTQVPPAWNGGGGSTAASSNGMSAGGGASDVRLIGGNWDDVNGLSSRFIVAGGGGGGGNPGGNTTLPAIPLSRGGHGGGIIGEQTPMVQQYASNRVGGGGGTQIAGGVSGTAVQAGFPSGFGVGAYSGGTNLRGAGGGGWFGGGVGENSTSGGGGSGFVYGMNQGGEHLCSAGSSYRLTNGVNSMYGESLFVANPDNSGSGYVRIKFISSFGSNACDTFSAAMDAIHLANVHVVNDTLRVTIRNKGIHLLDSATVYYSLNGAPIQSKVVYFQPPLDWGMAGQVAIGTYSTLPYQENSIHAWVKMPNNQYDSTEFDDSMFVKRYICSGLMQGPYTIGVGKDFPTLGDAIDQLSTCGVGGDVTFKLSSDTYTTAWNFTNQTWNGKDFSAMGNYMLTITSEANHRDSVIIKPASGVVVVTLNNTNNLTLEALTFGRVTTANCVQFASACTNIVIRNCKLLIDTTSTSTSYHPLSKASGTGVLDNFRMVGCLLEGGYYGGTQFYGGTANTVAGLAKNIVFDSNTFRCGYVYGMNAYYTYFTSISHNAFTSRTANNTNYWHGIYMNTGCHVEDIIGNRIRRVTSTGTTQFTYGHGIYLASTNITTAFSGRRPTVISNNEIIANHAGGSTSYGIYLSATGKSTDPFIHILHNSIYYTGTGASATYGIYFTSVPAGQMNVVKGNMIHLAHNISTAYPIYLNTAFSTTLYDIDANNMYAPINVGYAGAARADIAAWQSVVTTDKKSTRILPTYLEFTGVLKSNLKLAIYAGMMSVLDTLASEDIEGTLRCNPTSWGCHSNSCFNVDATVVNISGIRTAGAFAAETDSIFVDLYNVGLQPISSATICWNLRGVTQGSGIPWSGTLNTGDMARVYLGKITYVPGNNNGIEIFLCGLGLQTDMDAKNDTARVNIFVCAAPLSGTYAMPGYFANFNSLFDSLNICGASSDVRLAVANGTYTATWDFRERNLKEIMRGHTLTIASAANNPTSVIVRPSCNYPLMLGNTTNLAIDAITFDEASSSCGYYVVYISGPCSNIKLNNCRMLSRVSYDWYTYAVYAYTSTGIIDNFRMTNCYVDGGDFSVYFQGRGNTQENYFTNLVFDSNTFQNAYQYGLYLTNSHCKSISNNRILSISGSLSYPPDPCGYNNSAPYDWYGMYMSYANVEKLVGNTVLLRSPSYATKYYYGSAYGIMTNYANTLPVPDPKPMLIANNELILPYSYYDVDDYYGSGCEYGGYSYGIYLSSSGAPNAPVHVLHNSIYLGMPISQTPSGYSYAYDYGIYTSDRRGMHIIKRNIIHTRDEYSYPLYISGAFNPLFLDVDANNMYAPNYVGYTGSSTVSTVANWQNVVTTDKTSTKVLPTYVDNSAWQKAHLRLSNYSSFTAYKDFSVPQDIQGTIRKGITAWGAYDGNVAPSIDAALINLTGMKRSGQALFGQQDTLKVNLLNAGSTPITSAMVCWKVNGVVQGSGVPYNGTLAVGDFATITLGVLPYAYGKNDVVVYICGLGSLTDPNRGNDTAKYSTYLCQAPLSGTYTIGGAAGARNFANFNAFATTLDTCGAVGSLRLEFTGLHSSTVNLASIAEILNGVPLTIAGATGKDSITVAAGSAVTIGYNNRNITFDNIILRSTATASAYAVHITGACTNIVIRNCKLYVNSTSTVSTIYCLYKPSGTGVIDSFQLVSSLLDGGYYNFEFYGGIANTLTDLGKNIRLDSNIFQNAYYRGISCYNAYIPSISYNTVLSRTASNTTYWHGIYLNSACHPEDIVGNRIKRRTSTGTQFTYGHGIYLTSNNTTTVIPGKRSTRIVNNEIMANHAGGSTSYGIYVASTGKSTDLPIYIMHNSIYYAGTGSSATYGIDVASVPAGQMNVIKNNMIYLAHNIATAYPIYLGTAFSTTLYDIDANNMYAPINVGYAGAARATISAWQGVVTTDLNSVSILPSFANLANGLEMTSPVGFLCPAVAPVTNDINKDPRGIIVTMGCYEMLPPLNLNATLSDIVGLRNGVISGQTDTVKVVVTNLGFTTITSVNLGWSIDGNTQSAGTNYNVSLNMGKDTTLVLLPPINYAIGDMEVKVWINGVNGSGKDNRPEDDTISKIAVICSSGYSGVLTIGPSSSNNFKTIEEAFAAIDFCGVTGDITFAFEKGTYNSSLVFSNTAARFGSYKLTVTSQTGNRNDVIFQPVGVVVTLNNARNLTLENLTFGRITNHIVEFTSACSNIVIRNCNLLCDTTTTSSFYPLYKAGSTGVIDSFRMVGCLLDGGYYNVSFAGGTANSIGNFGTNIVWDSNTFKSGYYYALSPTYCYFTSISYNTFLGRINTSVPTYWYGLHTTTGCHVEDIICNKINQRGVTSYIYGLYLSSANVTTVIPNRRPTMIVNNEIIGTTFGSTTYGIYLNNTGKSTDPSIYVLHNSVYFGGTGAGATYGIYPTSVPAGQMNVIKNNMVHLTGTAAAAYPINLGTAFSTTLYDIDYNNMYAPTNVGYAGAARATIAAWQGVVTTDRNSVRVLPTFVNPASSLELTSVFFDSAALRCPLSNLVTTDINGTTRRPMGTTLGAYERPTAALDFAAIQVLPAEKRVVNNYILPISVEVMNSGLALIDSVTIGWSINGKTQTSISHVFNPSLNSYKKDTISVGTFTVKDTVDHYDIVVWIESANAQIDPIKLNDTASAVYIISPLARFTSPLVEDTISTLEFDVNVSIYEGTGAPKATPLYLYYHTTLGDCVNAIDSVAMTKSGGNYTAHIPQQYYGSKVVYWVHVADTMGNYVDLMDSTYIQFGGVGGGAPINVPYSGSVFPVQLKKGTYEVECWGANGGQGSNGGSTGAGGKGGYSKGLMTLSSAATVYVVVGGVGANWVSTQNSAGGYNGGGLGTAGSNGAGGGGGGATHISKVSGLLSNSGVHSNVIVVAGGGGGGNWDNAAGDGGGTNGGANSVANSGQGGTQSAGGIGGQGATPYGINGTAGQGGDGSSSGTNSGWSGGGGGGYYGGGGGNSNGSGGRGGGGGGSGYIGGVTNAITVQPAQSGFVTNPITNGNGYVIITPLSGGSDPYIGKNLSIAEVVSPANVANLSCLADDSVDVQVMLRNLGNTTRRFASDTINIMYKITDPRGNVYQGYLPIRSDTLGSGDDKTFTIMRKLAVASSGAYTIKAWVNSVGDIFRCDDTISYVYVSTKIGLPIDEDFTAATMPLEFVTASESGSAKWEPCQLDTNVMNPNHISKGSKDYGSRAIKFEGVNGDIATLSTRLLDLYGAVQPKLEFWYYHDTNTSPSDNSFLQVFVVENDVAEPEMYILKRNKVGTVHGWNHYELLLDKYDHSPCVYIMFYGMNRTAGAQYIDRIRITSYRNVAMKNVIIPKLQVCDFNNKEVKAVMYNPTTQYINFVSSPTRINLNINNTQNIIADKKTGGIASMGYDTVTFSGVNFVQGTKYVFQAWILDPIDDEPLDDISSKDSIFIDPDVEIALRKETTTGCLPIGFPVNQMDTVYNRSQNFDLFNIPIWAEVQNDNGGTEKIMYDTIPYIPKNSFVEHKFKDTYFVPKVSSGVYTVIANAVLACDYKTGNNENIPIQECADIHDIDVVEVLTPSGSDCDVRGDSVHIVARLINLDPYYTFSAVKIRAIISDGQQLQETIASIPVSKQPFDYKFVAPYIVPTAPNYTITVFVEGADANTANDTASANRCTKYDGVVVFDKTSFALGQNVPNPAKGNTRIDYNVPQDGQVVFTVYTITGQALFVEKREATSGKNDIVFNTDNLANGIYYYSMEYKGERLVKKMTIRK